jgi:hypothetical protein
VGVVVQLADLAVGGFIRNLRQMLFTTMTVGSFFLLGAADFIAESGKSVSKLTVIRIVVREYYRFYYTIL